MSRYVSEQLHILDGDIPALQKVLGLASVFTFLDVIFYIAVIYLRFSVTV